MNNNSGKIFFILFVFSCILISCSKKSTFDVDSLNQEIKITYENKYIYLEKSSNNSDTVLMFYPGGLVHEDAYIETLSKIVEKGINVLIIRMSFDLAVISKNRGLKQIENFPNAQTWFLSGHSLGGAMCCSVIDDNKEKFAGLILWAAYPSENDDISDYYGKALSIYASEDGLSTIKDIESKKSFLPSSTEYFLIEGGNHAQFGTFGTMKDDGIAKISKEIQQEIISDKTVKFIRK